MNLIQWLTDIKAAEHTTLMYMVIMGITALSLVIIMVIIPMIIITYLTFRNHPYPKHRHNKVIRLRLKTRRPVGM